MHTNVEIYSQFNGGAVLTTAGVLGRDNNLESSGEQTRQDSRGLALSLPKGRYSRAD